VPPPLNKSVPPTARAGPIHDALLPSQYGRTLHKPVFILFLIFFGIAWVRLLLGIKLPQSANWAPGLMMVLSVSTTLVALARRLPLQNVFWSGCLIAALAAIVESVGVSTGIPFGPRTYLDALGGKLLDVLPWPIPLAWIVILINCRGVARLIVRPWRKTDYYGFWVIGLTCLLATFLDLSLEPFAVRVGRYWTWQTKPDVLNWYTAPWVNFLAWFITALSILAFTMPWLVNKVPMKQPTDYHPLIMWQLFNLFFTTGNALDKLWPAVELGLATSVIVALFTIRGARWQFSVTQPVRDAS
jgi:uncharacterized membrane protein